MIVGIAENPTAALCTGEPETLNCESRPGREDVGAVQHGARAGHVTGRPGGPRDSPAVCADYVTDESCA
jgi:hypothetical protein